MKFQYVGCGNDDAPKKIKAFGHSFELGGEAVDVKNYEATKKLQGNKTFKAVGVQLLGETSDADDDLGADIEEALTDEPAKARRGRKPKAAEAA